MRCRTVRVADERRRARAGPARYRRGSVSGTVRCPLLTGPALITDPGPNRLPLRRPSEWWRQEPRSGGQRVAHPRGGAPRSGAGRIRGTAASDLFRGRGRGAALRPCRQAAADGAAAAQPADPAAGEGAGGAALRTQHPLGAAHQRGAVLPQAGADGPGRSRHRGTRRQGGRGGRVRAGDGRLRGRLVPRHAAAADPGGAGRAPGYRTRHEGPDLRHCGPRPGRRRLAGPGLRPAAGEPPRHRLALHRRGGAAVRAPLGPSAGGARADRGGRPGRGALRHLPGERPAPRCGTRPCGSARRPVSGRAPCRRRRIRTRSWRWWRPGSG